MRMVLGWPLLSLGLVCVAAFPQSLPVDGSGCGLDRQTGLERQEGDSWSPDGCNNCRCRRSGVPGCTKRLCSAVAPGAQCSEGARWEERSGDRREVCSCVEGNALCQELVVVTEPPLCEGRGVGETWVEEDKVCTCGEAGVTCAPPGIIRELDVTLQCGVDSKGRSRQVGDEWKEDCNTCRCGETGLPGCTRRLCQTFSTGDLSLDTKVQLGLQCGVDSSGQPRQVGDEWKEDCNTCRCGQTGLPGCTRRLCPQIQEVCIDRLGEERRQGERWQVERAGWTNDCVCEGGLVLCEQVIQEELEKFGTGDLGQDIKGKVILQCGVDSEGRSREVGDEWKEDCNTCRCGETGLPGCTRRLCPQEESKKPSTGVLADDQVPEGRVNFPGADTRQAAGCVDAEGGVRRVGSVWRQACNTCRCTGGRSSCTRRLCPAQEDLRSLSLLALVAQEAGGVAQCSQGGVTRCSKVRLQQGVLKSLKEGDSLQLLEGEGVLLELRREPTVTASGGVSLSFKLEEGGEGSVTVGSSGAMYGSIRPGRGEVNYVIEACGTGCNVLIERPSDWFNQFED